MGRIPSQRGRDNHLDEMWSDDDTIDANGQLIGRKVGSAFEASWKVIAGSRL